MTSYHLGIDTGGTFTDGALLDPASHQVLRTGKTITTHHDLSICIAQIMDMLLPDDRESVQLVSLSTTLATNAIAEGKSRPVGLFLLGYDPELVAQYGFDRQFSTEHYCFIQGGMNLQGAELAPLDEEALVEAVRRFEPQVEAFAVSSYGAAANSSHEERAAAIIAAHSHLPVVEGHTLSMRLDSIRRATTVSLNAALLSTTLQFMNTVQAMLQARNVQCPLIVVRGDGSLVRADFAARRPVEIIHSGPATSAIGGLYLAGLSDALVIDMGGTTTDLALLRNGRIPMDDGEATVGNYRTSVRTIRARSFGLGGDSQIRFDAHDSLSIGPSRVVPLSYLEHTHPGVSADLQAWLTDVSAPFYSDQMEYWMLLREPRQPFQDARTNRVIDLLRSGPKRMRWLLKQVGAVSAGQVDADLLVRREIIARAGLTPTDLLHVTGEYTPWNTALSTLAIEAVARTRNLTPTGFIQQVRRQMTEQISAEIIHFLSGYPVPAAAESFGVSSFGRWAFDESLSPAPNSALGCQIQVNVPLVGIGAPARAFLPPVAEALHTSILFPPHYEVANAVGAVVGNIIVQKEIAILPLLNGSVRVGYTLQGAGKHPPFDSLEGALAFARQYIRAESLAEAQDAGADHPIVEVSEQSLSGDLYTLSANVVARPALQ